MLAGEKGNLRSELEKMTDFKAILTGVGKLTTGDGAGLAGVRGLKQREKR